MSLLKNPSLPINSTILVTGANGYLGSAIASALLTAGYRVRGTVRSAAQHAWLTSLLTRTHGGGRFELVSVPDMAAAGAFDGALKDVAGVIHVAAVFTLSPDAARVIPPIVEGNLSLLRSLAAAPGVRRVVLTSTAGTLPKARKFDPTTPLTTEEWNEEEAALAFAEGEAAARLSEMQRGLAVYAAGKVRGEQAFWKYVREEEVGWVANSGESNGWNLRVVLPALVFGKPLSVEHQGFASSSNVPVQMLKGEEDEFTKALERYYWVDIEDVAWLHVAALINPELKNERIVGFSGQFSRNDVLGTFRKVFPGRDIPAHTPGLAANMAPIADYEKVNGLLKGVGKPGFKSLEECLRTYVDVM
ncbi:hypothetical protein SLS56_012174 [Neofusicoccum ribis]|uniref:NAD-dependent epimerase/dehydratase domain-containing protein n=1 Tax=Neofusicoccum ribis TaxID=45134 RepID=A0ABR3S9J3_9PEZI